MGDLPISRPTRWTMAGLPERATLIYDGECGLCQSAVARIRRWDRNDRLDYVAFQDPAVERFGIGLPALAAAMHLVLPDGKAFAGADAVPSILRRLPGKAWLAVVFLIPGVLPLARRVYRRIAERRHCVVRGLPRRRSGA